MSPWQAALIPLAIIAVLGSIAFFIGYRNLLSNDRADDVEPEPGASLQPAHSAGGGGGTALSPAETAARHQELRAKVAASERLIARAPQEQAIVVQFIDVAALGTAKIQNFLTELRRDFSQRITFVARHYPTSDQGRLGAAAIEAADRQGRFIPFLEHLTAGPATSRADKVLAVGTASATDSPSTSTAGSRTETAGEGSEVIDYVVVARRLGMDGDEFARDMADAATAAAIDADCAEARRAGINRAPALVLLDDKDNHALTSLEGFRRAVAAAAAASI